MKSIVNIVIRPATAGAALIRQPKRIDMAVVITADGAAVHLSGEAVHILPTGFTSDKSIFQERITMTTTDIETHPYNDLETIPPDTRLLIIGTAPPPRFSRNSQCGELRGLDFDFYYGSEDNYMWLFLEEIADDINYPKNPLFTDDDTSKTCIDTARAFLKNYKVWMYDVLRIYQRKEGRKCSPYDADIEYREFADFTPIFEKLSNLHMIAFTSEQAGIWAFEAFKDKSLITLDQHKIYANKFSEWKNIKISDSSREAMIDKKFKHPFLGLNIRGRELDFYLLPSPTGRSRMGLKISDKKDIYKKVIFGR